jgi:hypothetical protein
MNNTATFWVAVGISTTMLPILTMSRSCKWFNFLISLGLIFISGYMAYVFSTMIFVIDHAKDVTAAQAVIYEKEKFAANFWLLVFPAVFGGIGVNMLSNYLKPMSNGDY